MTKLTLTFAAREYDRVSPVVDGRATPEGIDLNYFRLPVEEIFYRQLLHREFDISEMSLSSYVMTLDRPDPEYIALPVFPSRYFRHQTMFVNTNSGISSPEDLRGKRVGLPEYQITAGVWQRGMLNDEYGVACEEMEFFTGGVDAPGRDEKLALDLPKSISVTRIGPEQTLSDMLAAGELDAVFSANVPGSFGTSPAVARLFPDYKAVEQDYYRRTRIFPIMHVLVVRRSILEANPWVARSLQKAFQRGLEVAQEDLRYRSSLTTMLPWLASHLDETVEAMGQDYWQYGLEANRHLLSTFLGYHFEQGLSRQLRTPDELFAPSASATFVI
ncbi:PhnD/SsuA/transferrin family substrate-binding protein [Microbacterium rhizophilus]|uniref:PhnD/SsuA/transferrin family substrate-binding protein n=1 Tax=Microbacterium rhizophilus TaxID=3138934 RepID=UPI0031E5EB23